MKSIHGHANSGTKSKTYSSWLGMKDRCHNPHASNYSRYGGRGIAVCESWRNSFPNFLNDMGERPAGKTLDRIDPKGNYQPNNCRWATPLEQSANRQDLRLITFNGETRRIADWAKFFNLSKSAMANRLSRGWTLEEMMQCRTIKPKQSQNKGS